jgi:hypothetical protein
MAAKLRIPDRFVPGLTAIAALPDDTLAALHRAFAETPDSLATDRLVDHVTAAVPQLSDDARDITEALLSLIALLPEDGSQALQLAQDVANSGDLDISPDTRAGFAERLGTLLDFECLMLAARATDLVAEHERVFHDARVLTDVRPVFGRDANQGPKAAVLISTLKIDFHPISGEVDSLFFALDRADLSRLRMVVDRALTKHDSLHKMLEQTDLPTWEYKDAPDA